MQNIPDKLIGLDLRFIPLKSSRIFRTAIRETPRPHGPAEWALKIIAARKWRNGHLMELAQKGLDGVPLDRELDSDLTEKEWIALHE